MAEVNGVGGAQSAAPAEQPKEAPKPEVNNAPAESPAPKAGADSKLGELNFQANQNKFNVAQEAAGAGAAAGAAAAKADPFDAEATVTRVGDNVIIDSGAGDDNIGVTQDAKTGDVTVNINGASRTFTGKDAQNLTIRAGDGNDTIAVDKNVTVNLTLEGGDGNDRIDGGSGKDTIRGGAGDDTLEGHAGDDDIDGGAGRDYLNGSTGDDRLQGGDGDDVVYGGDGNDWMEGGQGNDYLEGGRGNDKVFGDEGNDVVSGGLGDDWVSGGFGDDKLYSGGGKDTMSNIGGNDTIYQQTGEDTVFDWGTNGIKNTVVNVELKGNPGGASVVVNGSDEFRERVEADLEMLRSSPLGREMLTAFDDSKKTVTIVETNGGNAADWENRLKPGDPQPFIDATTRAKGTPNDATIEYNTRRVSLGGGGWQDRPPIVAFYHEMAHAYDFVSGTLEPGDYTGADNNGVPDSERTAVGLPIDHDKDPKTPNILSPLHPRNLTENAFRDELGLVPRPRY
jgi:Ca2+-binding RTX toxin-like protein